MNNVNNGTQAASEPNKNSDDVSESNALQRLSAALADEGNPSDVSDTNTNPEPDNPNANENKGENSEGKESKKPDENDDGKSDENGENGSDENDTDNPDGEEDEADKAAEKNPFEKSARGLLKRVDKLTARNKAKDDEIESLKREIQELKSGRQQPEDNKGAKSLVEEIKDSKQLDDFAAQTRSERDKVLNMLASDAPDFDVGGEVYTRDQLASYLKVLNKDLDENIPNKRKALSLDAEIQAKISENDNLIKETFPEFKEGSAEDKWIEQQLSDRLFDANKKILLHYAWRGLGVSKIEAQYRQKRETAKSAKSVPAAPADSAAPNVSDLSKAIHKDGSIDKDFAAKHLFD